MLGSPLVAPSSQPLLGILRENFNEIIEQADRHVVLDELFGYLKQHPHWIAYPYQRKCEEGISSSSAVAVASARSSLANEIGAVPVPVPVQRKSIDLVENCH